MEAVVFDFAMVLKRLSQLWFDRLSAHDLVFSDVRPLLIGPDAIENQFDGEPFGVADMIPAVVAALAATHGDDARDAAEAVLSVYSDSDAFVEIDGMYELVAELHAAGAKVGVLANGAAETEPAHLSGLIGSGAVDATVVAGRDGTAKPTREAFELIADRLGVKIEDCFFVDDVESNVVAAEVAGMTAFQFKGDVSELRLALTDAGVPG